jgi:hypothetical protein
MPIASVAFGQQHPHNTHSQRRIQEVDHEPIRERPTSKERLGRDGNGTRSPDHGPWEHGDFSDLQLS